MIQKTQENPDGYRGLVKNKLPPALENAKSGYAGRKDFEQCFVLYKRFM
jgi:hypothetical protein